MNNQEFTARYTEHRRWVKSEFNDGKRLTLVGADLSGLALSTLDLSHAHFVDCDFSRARLRYSNLSLAHFLGCDLRSADLTGVQTHLTNFSGSQIITPLEWIQENLEVDDEYVYAFKVFNLCKATPPYWDVVEDAVLTESVNLNRGNPCGCGVNIATLEWILTYSSPDQRVWKVRIPHLHLADVVVPFSTDGKFRTGYCEIVEYLGFAVDLDTEGNRGK